MTGYNTKSHLASYERNLLNQHSQVMEIVREIGAKSRLDCPQKWNLVVPEELARRLFDVVYGYDQRLKDEAEEP
jgi:hypothetical protein